MTQDEVDILRASIKYSIPPAVLKVMMKAKGISLYEAIRLYEVERNTRREKEFDF